MSECAPWTGGDHTLKEANEDHLLVAWRPKGTLQMEAEDGSPDTGECGLSEGALLRSP